MTSDTADKQARFSRNSKPHKIRGRMKEAHRSGDEGVVRKAAEVDMTREVHARTSHEMGRRTGPRKR